LNSATAARQRYLQIILLWSTLQTVLSAFRVLPTIPQTFPHFWILHFTFRIPQFRILPITDCGTPGSGVVDAANSHISSNAVTHGRNNKW